ncbi:MAG: hypothetical protein CVU56_19305 [Deltaproteobacteria bacterium HGW-Deltaproteobacteria-14]|nr:MAG: hypothetical protein CVU56_19305 [Deltaproteobacteria bacterium HGW-Deltaproteobacteria-14]
MTPPPITMADEPMQTDEHLNHSRGRVLVVDDQAMIVSLLTKLLTSWGYQVAGCERAAEALELIKKTTFDVIVTDIRMPDMSGVELMGHVRAHDADVPIILLTASPSLESAIQGIEHRAFRYLTKPIDIIALRETVEHAARLSRLGRFKRAAMVVARSEAAAAEDIELADTFTRALGTVWIAYQPLVDAVTNEPRGYEALLRTTDPTHPHPGAMLEAAERLGRLDELGRLVRHLSPVPFGPGSSDALLFVNLHPRDLMDPVLYETDTRLAAIASQVVLEITERAGLDDIIDVRGRVRDLRQLGYRIAIDDLGSGHSGLTSFAVLEPDFVKIDMSLVRDIDQSPIKRRLVRSMTDLCRDIGIRVVAEGIETLGERQALIDIGQRQVEDRSPQLVGVGATQSRLPPAAEARNHEL